MKKTNSTSYVWCFSILFLFLYSSVFGSEFIMYRNNHHGFQLSYLDNWTTVDAVDNASFVIERKDGIAPATISVDVARSTGNGEALMRAIRSDPEVFTRKLRSRFPTAELVNIRDTHLGGSAAHMLTSYYTTENLNSEMDIVIVQIVCIRAGNVYLVNFETVASHYESISEEFRLIVSTFKFLKSKPSPSHYQEMFWQQVYTDGGRTLYCDLAFGPGYNVGLNIEHVFPMAWVTKALKCGTHKQCRRSSERFNRIEGDLHNLYPSRTDVNEARGAMRFGEISGERRWRGGGCDFEVDEGAGVVEPRPGARGEIARAIFYMRDTYGMTIFDDLGQRLKRWHRDDPVGVHERQRNDAIERLQGTRNKYIDEPQLVERIQFE